MHHKSNRSPVKRHTAFLHEHPRSRRPSRRMALCILLSLPLITMAESTIIRHAPDRFEIRLHSAGRDSLRLLQVTDLHLGHTERLLKDVSTFRRLQALVEQQAPDAVVITGDCFTGDSSLNRMALAYVPHIFDQWQRPWVLVFGNHDPEGGRSRDSLYAAVLRSRWGVLGRHQSADGRYAYDYQVLFTETFRPVPLWEVYAFDSGSGPGSKKISAASLSWFQRRSNESRILSGRIVPALAVFHIPLKQYHELAEGDLSAIRGEKKEPVCFEEDDGLVLEIFAGQGNIRACFCGHDHYNNYYGRHCSGILLAYGYISGESTKWAWPTGGRLIALSLKGDGVQLYTVLPH